MGWLRNIVLKQKQGEAAGIYSCCSANEYVIRAVMRKGIKYHTPVLIEATANQVNQNGGYMGMTPKDFYFFVHKIADEESFDKTKLILGGDHLGPLAWSDLPESEAMDEAEELIRRYAAAGFTKLHIDTSMRLGSDSRKERLSDEVIADRCVRLCRASEKEALERRKKDPEAQMPDYVIGSEVPVPGGIREEDDMAVTSAEDCRRTLQIFKEKFEENGLSEVWSRVAALVVQPGVEFGDAEIHEYDREKAKTLSEEMRRVPGMVMEGHSTDYQTREKLKEMVEDGIAVLKVGPALTFAMREGLFALENIERELFSGAHRSYVRETLEEVMLQRPDNWKKYYHGTEKDIRSARAFSFSDRCRYYFHEKEVEDAVRKLLGNLERGVIPYSLLSQYLPVQYRRVRTGELINSGYEILLDYIGEVCEDYLYAALG